MADVGQAVFRAIADFSRLRREAKRASREFADLRDETEDVNDELRGTTTSATAAGEALDDAGDEARGTARELRGLSREGSTARRVLLSLAAAARSFGAAIRDSPVRRFTDRVERMRTRVEAAGGDLDRLDKRVDRIGNSFLRAAGMVAKFTAILGGIAVATGAVHAATAGVLALLGAIGALTGAVGLLPGVLAAAGLGMATLKVGTSGFGDAVKAVVEGDLEKFTEAVKGLSGSARQTAWAIWEMRGPLKMLRDRVQHALFLGFADRVRQLGYVYLPEVRRAMVDVAGSFNQAARNVADFLLTADAVRDVESILDNVAAGFDRLGGIAENVAAAFLDLTTVSAEFLPGLADGLDEATGEFRRFIRQARESGDLAEWIQSGIDAVKRLGSVLGNVGSILYGLFKAGDAAGANFLETVDRLTQRLADFVHSARGQRAIGRFFESARRAADALLPVLEALVRNLGEHVSPVLADIAEVLGPGLVNVVDGIGAAFENAGPGLVDFFEGVSDLLTALGKAGPLIGDIAGVLGSVLGPALSLLAGIIRLVVGAWEALPGPVQSVIAVFGAAALAAGGLLLALYKIIRTAKKVKAALAVISAATGFGGRGRGRGRGGAGGTTFLPFPDPADARRKGGAAGTAARKGFLAKFGRGLKGALGLILQGALLGLAFFPGAVGKIGRKAKTLFTGGFKGTAPAATGIMGRVGTAIRGVGPKALAVASKLKWLRLAFSATPWGLAINGLILAGTLVWTHWDTITRKVKGAWDGTVRFFQGLGPRIQTAWNTGTTWMANLPTTAQQTVNGIGAWFDKLPARVGLAAGYAGVWVVREFGRMRDQAVARTAGLLVGAGRFFSQLPGRLGNAARTAGTWVKNTFRDMKDGAVANTGALLAGATGFFRRLPGNLGNLSRQAGTAAKNAFRDMKDRVVENAALTVGGVVGFFRDLPGKLERFKDDLVDVGRGLMEGLASGIRAMAQRVVNNAVDVVVGAVAGARRAARSGSPSRVFMGIGVDIGQGLALGIERMRDRVVTVVERIVNAISGLFGPALASVQTRLSDLFSAARRAPVPTAAGAAPSVGGLLAGALPDLRGVALPDLDAQLRAALRPAATGHAAGGVTANFTVFNPLPEPASDTAARKLRTLALMGAFG